MRRPEAWVFDLDGTLVDSVPDLAIAVQRMMSDLGLDEVSEAQVRDWVGNGATALVVRALTGGADEGVDGAHVEEALALFKQHYHEVNGMHSQLYPGVYDFLELLSDLSIPMGIVTNKPEEFIGTLLSELQIDGFFNVLIGGDTCVAKKPDPGPIQEAARQLGVLPEDAVMVGDSETDINAARSAGMPVACVDYGYNHGRSIAEFDPDWTLSSFEEMVDIFELD